MIYVLADQTCGGMGCLTCAFVVLMGIVCAFKGKKPPPPPGTPT